MKSKKSTNTNSLQKATRRWGVLFMGPVLCTDCIYHWICLAFHPGYLAVYVSVPFDFRCEIHRF